MTEQRTDTGTDLVLTEEIAAPPNSVFDFLVDEDKVARWMGTAIDIEPRAGGKFWLNANGTDIASGTYVEVDRPHRVVFTWGWEGSDDVPPGSSTVTISLTESGDNTIVELRHRDLPGAAGDPHSKGWAFFLARLSAVSEGRDPGPAMHAG